LKVANLKYETKTGKKNPVSKQTLLAVVPSWAELTIIPLDVHQCLIFYIRHNRCPAENYTFYVEEETALCHEHILFCFLLPRTGKKPGVVLFNHSFYLFFPQLDISTPLSLLGLSPLAHAIQFKFISTTHIFTK